MKLSSVVISVSDCFSYFCGRFFVSVLGVFSGWWPFVLARFSVQRSSCDSFIGFIAFHGRFPSPKTSTEVPERRFYLPLFMYAVSVSTHLSRPLKIHTLWPFLNSPGMFNEVAFAKGGNFLIEVFLKSKKQ